MGLAVLKIGFFSFFIAAFTYSANSVAACSMQNLVGRYGMKFEGHDYSLHLMDDKRGFFFLDDKKSNSFDWGEGNLEDEFFLLGDNSLFSMLSVMIKEKHRSEQLSGVKSGYFMITASCSFWRTSIQLDEDVPRLERKSRN